MTNKQDIEDIKSTSGDKLDFYDIVASWTQQVLSKTGERGSLTDRLKSFKNRTIDGQSIEDYEKAVLKKSKTLELNTPSDDYIVYADKNAVLKKWNPTPKRRPPMTDREFLECVARDVQSVNSDIAYIKRKISQ